MSTQNAPGGKVAIEHGVHEGIAWAVVEAPMYGAMNGYVRVPENHPWFRLGYSDPELSGVEVHGGLTYDDQDGWIGFDTLHSGDYWPSAPDFYRESQWARHWDQRQVASETRALAQQVADASKALGNLPSREALDAEVRTIVVGVVDTLAENGVDRVSTLASLLRQVQAVLDGDVR